MVMLRNLSLIAAIIQFLLSPANAAAQTLPDRPDPMLTPGATLTTDVGEICAPGYSRAHRVWHDKLGTLHKYGLLPSDARRVEDDDRVPICAGGDNASPLNHWPQSWRQAREKDREEERICRAVCDGEMRIEDAQRYFLNWSPTSPVK